MGDVENSKYPLSYSDIDVIPYNHWVKDCEWIVFVRKRGTLGIFIPVHASIASEACKIAISQYKYLEEIDE